MDDIIDLSDDSDNEVVSLNEMPEGDIIDLSNDSDDDVSLNEMTEGDINNTLEDEDRNSDPQPSDCESDFEIIEAFRTELTQEEEGDAIARHPGDDYEPSSQPASASGTTLLPFSYVTIKQCMTSNRTLLQPGMCVELSLGVSIDQKNSDFLRISAILQDLATDQIFLQGFRFRRANRLKGILEKKLNEVYLCRKSYNVGGSISEQSVEKIALGDDVLCVRELILTNKPYPSLSFRGQYATHYKRDAKVVKETAQLVCRYAYTVVYGTGTRVEEYRVERLSEQEADPEHAMSDQTLRAWARIPLTDSEPINLTLAKDRSASEYREVMNKVFHRSQKLKTGNKDVINLDDDDVPEVVVIKASDDEESKAKTTKARNLNKSQNASPPGHRTRRHSPDEPYTFGDAFCGAGGVSSGARRAGLKLLWAFDHWVDAYSTYKANFRGTGVRVFRQEVFEFVTEWEDGRMVDILHISPPCQAWSPAHTHAGKNDEANAACLFAVGLLVRKARPRVVTIEETAGLQTHHPVFLHHLLQELTNLGYSIRWKVMNLAQYGLVQPRKRLMIIASCPGESLPLFPSATHSAIPGPSLKPLTTIRDVLSRVHPAMQWQGLAASVKRDVPPYDPDTQLRGCITTSGGGDSNLHPSGLRTFTCRELACLQSFPTNHVFWGLKTSVLKQIGNAVPPLIARQLFEAIVLALRATDAAADAAADAAGASSETAEEEEEEEEESRAGGKGPEDPIILD